MIDLLDGPLGVDDWGHLKYDENNNVTHIWFEESDKTEVFTTSHIVFTRGKYQGSLLSEVSDSWYLKFIRDKNPDDHFVNWAFGKRIAELAL